MSKDLSLEGWKPDERLNAPCPNCGFVGYLGAFRRSDGVPLRWIAQCDRASCGFRVSSPKLRTARDAWSFSHKKEKGTAAEDLPPGREVCSCGTQMSLSSNENYYYCPLCNPLSADQLRFAAELWKVGVEAGRDWEKRHAITAWEDISRDFDAGWLEVGAADKAYELLLLHEKGGK